MKRDLPFYLRRNVKAMKTRTSTKHGVGSIKDRSVREIIQKKAMSPREFWAHIAEITDA